MGQCTIVTDLPNKADFMQDQHHQISPIQQPQLTFQNHIKYQSKTLTNNIPSPKKAIYLSSNHQIIIECSNHQVVEFKLNTPQQYSALFSNQKNSHDFSSNHNGLHKSQNKSGIQLQIDEEVTAIDQDQFCKKRIFTTVSGRIICLFKITNFHGKQFMEAAMQCYNLRQFSKKVQQQLNNEQFVKEDFILFEYAFMVKKQSLLATSIHSDKQLLNDQYALILISNAIICQQFNGTNNNRYSFSNKKGKIKIVDLSKIQQYFTTVNRNNHQFKRSNNTTTGYAYLEQSLKQKIMRQIYQKQQFIHRKVKHFNTEHILVATNGQVLLLVGDKTLKQTKIAQQQQEQQEQQQKQKQPERQQQQQECKGEQQMKFYKDDYNHINNKLLNMFISKEEQSTIMDEVRNIEDKGKRSRLSEKQIMQVKDYIEHYKYMKYSNQNYNKVAKDMKAFRSMIKEEDNIINAYQYLGYEQEINAILNCRIEKILLLTSNISYCSSSVGQANDKGREEAGKVGNEGDLISILLCAYMKSIDNNNQLGRIYSRFNHNNYSNNMTSIGRINQSLTISPKKYSKFNFEIDHQVAMPKHSSQTKTLLIATPNKLHPNQSNQQPSNQQPYNQQPSNQQSMTPSKKSHKQDQVSSMLETYSMQNQKIIALLQQECLSFTNRLQYEGQYIAAINLLEKVQAYCSKSIKIRIAICSIENLLHGNQTAKYQYFSSTLMEKFQNQPSEEILEGLLTLFLETNLQNSIYLLQKYDILLSEEYKYEYFLGKLLFIKAISLRMEKKVYMNQIQENTFRQKELMKTHENSNTNNEDQMQKDKVLLAQSISILQKAFSRNIEKIQDKPYLMNILEVLGDNHVYVKKYGEAQEYYEKARLVYLFIKQSNQHGKYSKISYIAPEKYSQILSSLANVYFLRKQYSKAIKSYEESLNFISPENQSLKNYTIGNMGLVQIYSGDSAQGKGTLKFVLSKISNKKQLNENVNYRFFADKVQEMERNEQKQMKFESNKLMIEN